MIQNRIATLSFVSADEAVGLVKSGDRVFVQGAAMTPCELLDALARRAPVLKDVELISLHTEGSLEYLSVSQRSFRHRALFCGANVRAAVAEGSADYVPVFLGEIGQLFRSKEQVIDVAFIMVSPPDAHGFCSLGVSVDVAVAAIDSARDVIAVVNQRAPRTHGDGVVHFSAFSAVVEVDRPLFSHDPDTPTEAERRIGRLIAELVEDGSTIQVGIGGIPNAVLASLGSHKDLGIHTEMFSDGMLPLLESGVITNSYKTVVPRRSVSSFIVGSERLYRFVDDNPSITLKEASFTNDPMIIGQNPRVVAINSCLEIDLTGQICADSLGTYQYSGVGGQLDFMRGAALSEGGKPIIAFSSTTSKGLSKIVPQLSTGASVTTTRAHVRYVVTEFGVVDLFGKSLRERAWSLINIAHPDHRERLEQEAWSRFKVKW